MFQSALAANNKLPAQPASARNLYRNTMKYDGPGPKKLELLSNVELEEEYESSSSSTGKNDDSTGKNGGIFSSVNRRRSERRQATTRYL